jgi:hypothetical protein
MSHGRTAPHPQQTSEQLPPHLGERLQSSDGEAAWNDRHGRVLAVGAPWDGRPLSILRGHSLSIRGMAEVDPMPAVQWNRGE